MAQVEDGGPHTVDRVEPESGELCWHVRGSAHEFGGRDSAVWTVRS